MSDLATLFAKNPFQYSDQDLKELIKAFRERHTAFRSGLSIGAGKVAKPTPKQAELITKVDTSNLDI